MADWSRSHELTFYSVLQIRSHTYGRMTTALANMSTCTRNHSHARRRAEGGASVYDISASKQAQDLICKQRQYLINESPACAQTAAGRARASRRCAFSTEHLYPPQECTILAERRRGALTNIATNSRRGARAAHPAAEVYSEGTEANAFSQQSSSAAPKPSRPQELLGCTQRPKADVNVIHGGMPERQGFFGCCVQHTTEWRSTTNPSTQSSWRGEGADEGTRQAEARRTAQRRRNEARGGTRRVAE